jgi:Zn-finger nucleic acid-binding protein
MKCPRDYTELENQVHSALMLFDYCPKCKGVFLTPEELHSIENSKDSDTFKDLSTMPEFWNQEMDVDAHKSFESIKCPSCNVEMTTKEYGFTSRIIVDTCPQCRSVWLDRGELKAIESFIEVNRVSSYSQKGFVNKFKKLFR